MAQDWMVWQDEGHPIFRSRGSVEFQVRQAGQGTAHREWVTLLMEYVVNRTAPIWVRIPDRTGLQTEHREESSTHGLPNTH